MDLINQLINQGWLKTDRIIKAFQKIKRIDFVIDDFKNQADLDEALPIGFQQTISQPLTVAFMLELLEPKEQDNILDIGFGSGWTTSLLAEIVGLKGKVTALEINSQLKQFGEKNISKYNFIKKNIVQTVLADGSKGYSKNSLYDKILVSATATRLPDCLKKQLKINGRIVMPIDSSITRASAKGRDEPSGSSIWLFVKKTETDFQAKEYPGFIFVPLVNG